MFDFSVNLAIQISPNSEDPEMRRRSPKVILNKNTLESFPNSRSQKLKLYSLANANQSYVKKVKIGYVEHPRQHLD